MSGSQLQIVTAYEVSGMTPEQIADDMGGDYDVASIKAALMAGSSKYRKDCGQESPENDSLNFTNDDLAAVNDVIMHIAKYADDPNLQLKAAMYVRDDKKGRKEIVRQIAGNNTFNLLQFNESLAAARLGAEAIKQQLMGTKQKAIEA